MFVLSKNEWDELITNCDSLPDGVKFCFKQALPSAVGKLAASRALNSKSTPRISLFLIIFQ